MFNGYVNTIMCSVSAVPFAPCPLRCHDSSAKWYKSSLPARSKQDTFPHSDIKTWNKTWHVAFLFFSTKTSTRDCHVASTLLSFPKFTQLKTHVSAPCAIWIHPRQDGETIPLFASSPQKFYCNNHMCVPSSFRPKPTKSDSMSAGIFSLPKTKPGILMSPHVVF